MRIAVLGTGGVGRTLANKLVEVGHEVTMGSRAAGNEKAVAWAAGMGDAASEGTFAVAAGFGEIVVNATAGAASLDVMAAAGEANLAGKVVIDVSNPLDFSAGFPPSLTVCNTDSVAEQIQRAFPEARVVKSLNTINSDVMVDPTLVAGPHNVFVCGNDADAKARTKALLESFGWPSDDIVDLGDLAAARGLEMYLPLWLRMMGVMGTGHFNIHVRPPAAS